MRVTKWFAFIMLFALLSVSAFQQATAADEKAKSDDSGITGAPAPGSKFSKIKLGMSLNEVIAKIGEPARRWEHPTGKVAIPFYFGPDRHVWELSYNGEGLLTFNTGGGQALTHITVNKSEGKDNKSAEKK
jgi:hypothetical protein